MKRLLLLLLLASPAFATYNHIRVLTVPASQVANTTQSNFPVTLVGTFPYLALGQGVISSSGYDMIITSDSACTIKRKFQRVYWDSATGTVDIKYWQILSPTSANISYLCYGNAAITTDQQLEGWDANTLFALPFKSATSLSILDGTGNQTFTSSGSPTAGRGQIQGGILTHNATSDYLSGGTVAGLQSSTSVTIEAWVNPESFQSSSANTGLVTYGKSGTDTFSLYLQNDGTSTDRTPNFIYTYSGGSVSTPGFPLRLGQWYYIAGVYDSVNSLCAIYVNGYKLSQPCTNAALGGDGTQTVSIGKDVSGSTQPSFFDGAIDEVRVSSYARTADWITTTYRNLSSPSTFVLISPELTNSSNFSNVSVSGVTNTQAEINFNYSGSLSGCHVWVSENPSMYPLVHDTDPALFTNADQVSRDSANLVTGSNVKFVVGKRYQAYLALDGNRRSRALHQNAPHYWMAACNSGADTYAGSFRTSTLALGNTHVDGIPMDPNNPGSGMWPSVTGLQRCNTFDLGCSIDRRNTTYIDPQTGVLLRHLTMPEDNTIWNYHVQANLYTGSGWTFCTNWNTAGCNATSTAGSTAPLVVGGWQNAYGNGFSSAFQLGDIIDEDGVYIAPLTLQYSITASTSNSACTAGNTNADCAITVCVSLNWTTCAANAQLYTLYLTTTPTVYTVGSGQPYDDMQQAGKRIWTEAETGWRSGSVTCNGSTTVTKTWDSNTIPPDLDPPGSYIDINASGVGWQPIASNIDALHFTLPVSCPTGTYSNYPNVFASSFGVMAYKQTTSSDVITISNQYINTLAYQDHSPQYNSGFYGSSNTVTLPNGDPGAFVALKQSDYSIDLNTGQAWPALPNAISNSAVPPEQSSAIDPTSSGSQLILWSMDSDLNVWKSVYSGDFLSPVSLGGQLDKPLYEWNDGATMPACNSYTYFQCIESYTQITQSATGNLATLLAAFDSNYNSTYFNSWNFIDIEQGPTGNPVLIFDINYNGAPAQNHLAWMFIFDPYATSNVNGTYGAGCVGSVSNPVPGCIVAAKRNWASPGARWTVDKEIGQMLQPGWAASEASVYAFGGAGGGPAVTNKNSSLTTLTCPANPYGWTSCVSFTVDGDPYDFLAGSGTRGNLGPVAVGDFAILGTDDITYPNPPNAPYFDSNTSDLMQLVQISGSTLTFGCVYGASQCYPGDVNPQMLWFYSSWPGFQYPWAGAGMVDLIMWDWADDPHGTNSTGKTIVWSYSSTGAHGANGNYLFSQGYTNNGTLCALRTSCYNNQIVQGLSNLSFANYLLTPTYNNVQGLVTLSPSFDGVQGSAGYTDTQTHPDYTRLGTDLFSHTFVDGRPYIGLGGSPNQGDIMNVSGSLWKVPYTSGYTNPKILDTMVSSARFGLSSVSGPSSSITGTSADYYHWCRPLVAGECYEGSAVGDFYFNIPYLLHPFSINGSLDTSGCYVAGGFANGQSDNWTINDTCILDTGSQYQSYFRYRLDTFDYIGWSTQQLGKFFSPGRASIFLGIHPATNVSSPLYRSWYYFITQDWDGVFTTMLAEAPPVSPDSVNRSIFEPVTIPIHQVSGGNGAAVQFWYSEYSTTTSSCSPNRAEACLAVSATVNTSTPFYWATEAPTPLSCASNCSIQIPALPEHVVYYHILLYNGTTLVYTGPTQIAISQ